jgi:glyoxylase-like metal-dependent hydrolase (beta-lactamase superfamily II)
MIRLLPGRGYECNLYLIEGREPILIDTGTGQHVDHAIKAIGAAMDLGRLKRIILTHRHYDHVGGAPFLAERLGAEVFIHELDAEVVRKGDDLGTQASIFGGTAEPVEVTCIREGETFSTGEHELEVLHTPGHTAGSICLFDEGKKDLISGDTVFVGGVGRWDLPSGNFDDLLASMRSLQALDIRNIYPGHGPCGIGSGNEQIREALSYLGDC